MVASSSRGSTKSGKAQIIPLSPGAKEAWNELKHALPGGTGTRISHWFTYDARNAGLQASAHMLRHTFATMLLMNNTPITVVQRLLGHSKIETTMVYAHIVPGMLKNSVDFLTI